MTHALTSASFVYQIVPFESYKIELPGVSGENANTTQFEIVVVETKSLQTEETPVFGKERVKSNSGAPAIAFDAAGSSKVRFIAPTLVKGTSKGALSCFSSFLRSATPKQAEQFWSLLAKEFLRALDTANMPVWLSSDAAGAGASRAHCRIDLSIHRPAQYLYFSQTVCGEESSPVVASKSSAKGIEPPSKLQVNKPDAPGTDTVGLSLSADSTQRESCEGDGSENTPETENLDMYMDVEEMEDADEPSIVYECVQENRGLKRYAAINTSTGCPMTILEWAQTLSVDHQSGEDARQGFNAVIEECPFKAVFFETKGCDKFTANEQFEFVLLDAPGLKSFAKRADGHAFKEHFSKQRGNPYAVSFTNLGGDACLVSPKPFSGVDRNAAYGHIAAFCRNAPKAQVSQLWKLAATKYLEYIIMPRKVWLSTNGMGVAWMHLRMDSRPKYYQYTPFKKTGRIGGGASYDYYNSRY